MTSVSQDLLFELYARVQEPMGWSGVLDRVCSDLKVRSAVVQRMNRGSDDQVNTTWLVRDSYSEENSALHDEVIADRINPRMKISRQRPDLHSKPILCDDDFDGLAGTDGQRFRESLRSIGLGNFMSSGAQLPGGERIAMVLHRHVDNRKEFDAREREYVRHLAQHLGQALILSDRFQQERHRSAALGSVVDSLRFGVALCNPGGEVIWANNKAQNMLATHPAVHSREGRIACNSSGNKAIMSQLFSDALLCNSSGRGSSRVAIGGNRGDPLHCMAIGVAGDSSPGAGHPALTRKNGRIALFLSSPSQGADLDPEGLEHLLGLSPAESRVAAAICSGMCIRDYARSRSLSEGTVRFQLKQVLAKTGTSRQADLVRLVFSSLAAEIIPPHT